MKFVIAGKNTIAVDVLEFLLRNDNEVFVVLNRNESYVNNFQKSLGFFAEKWGVPILDLNETYGLTDIIFLSLEFDRIIKPELFVNPQRLYNIHFSLLPAYKGMYTSALPILQDEEVTGVTLHKIDAGIDTGDIIDQEKIYIKDTFTSRDLYLEYIKKGTELVIKNLPSLIDKSYTAVKQTIENSTYFGKEVIDYQNLKINYNKTAHQIINQLRAFSFREFQMPKFKEYSIFSWKVLKEKSNLKAGSIVEKRDKEITISTIDYDLVLYIDLYSELWSSCKKNDVVKLKSILSGNCLIDLENKSKEGWTALMIAAYNDAYECVLELIQYGADVNASNYNGTTVLMYAKSGALRTQNLSILTLLLDNGADPRCIDVFNKTVLDWVKDENEEIYSFLKSRL